MFRFWILNDFLVDFVVVVYFYFGGFCFLCVWWFIFLFRFFSKPVASEMLKVPTLGISQGNT